MTGRRGDRVTGRRTSRHRRSPARPVRGRSAPQAQGGVHVGDAGQGLHRRQVVPGGQVGRAVGFRAQCATGDPHLVQQPHRHVVDGPPQAPPGERPPGRLDAQQGHRLHPVPRLLLDLPHHGVVRVLPVLRPAARQRPLRRGARDVQPGQQNPPVPDAHAVRRHPHVPPHAVTVRSGGRNHAAGRAVPPASPDNSPMAYRRKYAMNASSSGRLSPNNPCSGRSERPTSVHVTYKGCR